MMKLDINNLKSKLKELLKKFVHRGKNTDKHITDSCDRILLKIVPVIYTDELDNRYGARTYCIFPITWIKIRPKYKDDTGLLLHELTHVKQIYRTLGLHCILYPLYWRYRLRAEIEAYSRQLAYYKIYNPEKYQPDFFVQMIQKKYNLPRNKETSTNKIKTELLLEISKQIKKFQTSNN